MPVHGPEPKEICLPRFAVSKWPSAAPTQGQPARRPSERASITGKCDATAKAINVPQLSPCRRGHVVFVARRDEAIRFALEYAKAELALRDWGIRSTIIVFGSARIRSPEQAAAAAQTARDAVENKTAERLKAQSKYYEVAREFARFASQMGGAVASGRRRRDNVIATGGGPGIMDAANRGAFEASAPSIGFNIALPQEQRPNPYITPELSFQFHYFAMRKMHLAMRASALAIFPGGFGTLDELFELLTLQQTRKAPPAPIVLFGEVLLAQAGQFRDVGRGRYDLAGGFTAFRVCRERRGRMGFVGSSRIADAFLPGRCRKYGLMCVNVTICVTANAGDGKARLTTLQ